jgi:hypothetical protein
MNGVGDDDRHRSRIACRPQKVFNHRLTQIATDYVGSGWFWAESKKVANESYGNYGRNGIGGRGAACGEAA